MTTEAVISNGVGGKPHRGASRRKIILATGSFFVLSLSMVFLNRILFAKFKFDYPKVILILQYCLTLIMVEIWRNCGKTDLPFYTLERGRAVVWLSVAYACHAAASLNALIELSVPIYGTIKRCVPVVNILLGLLILKHPLPRRGVLIAVALITTGAIMISWHGLSIESYYLSAYISAFISVISHSVYLLMVQKLSPTFSPLELIYINSYNGIFITIILDLIDDEVREAWIYAITIASPRFWLYLIVVLICGCALQFAAFVCTSVTSALTCSIVGVSKSVLQTLGGLLLSLAWLNDFVATIPALMGIGINLLGSCLYAYVKYREQTASA